MAACSQLNTEASYSAEKKLFLTVERQLDGGNSQRLSRALLHDAGTRLARLSQRAKTARQYTNDSCLP